MKYATALFLCIALQCVVYAQTETPASPDAVLPLAYDPGTIMEEWNAYFENPTEEKTFIKDFMKAHEVPQTALYGLDRKGTWYWWISNNPEKISKYLALKAEAEKP